MYLFQVTFIGWPENPCSRNPMSIIVGTNSRADDVLSLGTLLDACDLVVSYEVYDLQFPGDMLRTGPFGFHFKKQKRT